MDWLRRNWPDLAIGLALVAVIGGIIATLITGGTFFPSTPAAPAPAPAPTAPAVVPPAPDPVVVPEEPTADAPPASPGSVSVLAPDGSDVPTEPAAASPPAAAAPPAVAPEPAAPEPSPEPATAVTPPPASAPAPASAAPAAPSTPAPATPPAAAPTGPLPTASSVEEAPYRVSVGAFGNPDNAARLAQTFRDAGYPVFSGIQGNLTIVLVGPYDSEAEAERVSARIATGGFGIDPVVYRFRPDAATPGASTPAPSGASAPIAEPTPAPAPAATPSPAAPPAAAPAPPAPTTPIATAPTGRSLQVGAFADAGSAAPLRERLAALGLVAFEIREDGLIKLLVGPFEEARLSEVRGQLSAQGIESFPR
jgi:cell division septation protein DedD